MHCMYTAPKQNVQKVILLRILVVSKRLSICLKLETRNIKKKYRLLPGRKHFRLHFVSGRRITRHDNIFGVRATERPGEKCLQIQNCVNSAPIVIILVSIKR